MPLFRSRRSTSSAPHTTRLHRGAEQGASKGGIARLYPLGSASHNPSMDPADIPLGWAILVLRNQQAIGGYVEVVTNGLRIEVHVTRLGNVTYCKPEQIASARACLEEEALEV